MPTSSASPDDLNGFVTRAGEATRELGTRIAQVRQQLDDYLTMPSDYRFVNGEAVIGEVVRFNANNAADEKFVATVREAFIRADTNTLPDGAIAKALADAGVSLSPRQAVTVDEPMFRGKPISSGFSDDPVCTATGHFLEVADDLVMPGTLRVLRWTRTYSSRFIVRTPLGRGWYSWASTELIERDEEVHYQGPDGQVAVFLPADEGFERNPGVEADVVRAGDGLQLRWRWTARFPGMIWSFDGEGQLRRVEDPFGGTTTCERDEWGRHAAMTHEGGRRLVIEWEGELIAAVSCSDGRGVRYQYDDADLTYVRRPSGDRRYTTDDAGRVTEIIDGDGVRLVANRYDDEGRVVSQRSPFGRVTRYRYLMPLTVIVGDDEGVATTLYRHDAAGRLVELHTAEGRRMTRQFDALGNPVQVVGLDGNVTTRQFDPDGNCVRELRSDGTEQRWEYDQLGRVTAFTDGVGARFRLMYDSDSWYPARVEGPHGWWQAFESRSGVPIRVTDADGVTSTLERDGDGVVLAIVDALGHRLEFVPHRTGALSELRLPTGERRRFEVDDAGRVLTEITPSGARMASEVSDGGRLQSIVDPEGATVRFGWGNHGALATLTDAAGGVTRAAYDVLGNLTGVEWPNGAEWHFRYDGMRNVTTMQDPLGAQWTRHWSPGGVPEGFTDPLGYRWSVESDGVGRPSAVTTPLGRRLELRYDAAGRPVEATTGIDSEASPPARVAIAQLRRDDLGRPVELIADGSPVARYTYTAAGRMRSLITPDGSAWRFEYDARGLLAAVNEPNGGRTSFEYDAVGRLVAQVAPTGGRIELAWGVDGQLAELRRGRQATRWMRDRSGRIREHHLPGGGVRRYAYGPRGDVISVTDPLGGLTVIQRGPLGNPVELIDPKGASWSWELDALGQVVGQTDPLGRRTRVELDPAGRLVATAGPDGEVQSFGWDPEGLLATVTSGAGPLLMVERDVTGQRASVRERSGTVTEVEWDARGRLANRRVGGRTTRWVYDDASRRITVIPAVGEPAIFELDAADRIVAVQYGPAGPVELVRDLCGRLVELRARGLRRVWQRDEYSRVVGYREQLGDRSREIRIERDLAGRVVAEHIDGRSRRYRYDVAGQLTSFGRDGGTWTWGYDNCGRVNEELGPAGRRRFVYDDADELVRIEAHDGLTRFTYDGRGRRTGELGPKGSVRYRWDELGRLTAVDQEAVGAPLGVTVDAVVDGLGWLAAWGDTPVDWLPGGALGELPLAVGDRQILALPGLPVGTVRDGQIEWVSADWRGTVGDDSRPWGPAGFDGELSPQLGYLGELQLGRLVWLRQRVYDPSTHAFLTTDPAGLLAGSVTPYAYANNDPLGWIDPLGLRPLTIEEAKAQMESWQQGHWKELAITVGALAVTGAVIVLTGGAAAPIAFAAIGFAAGAGGTAVNDVMQHKPIDPMDVLMNGSIGAMFGAVGARVPIPDAILGRVAVGGLYSSSTSLTGSVGAQWAEEGKVNWTDTAIDTGFGTVTGLIPGIKNSDFSVPGLKPVPDSTETVYNGVIQGHYMPIAALGNAITKTAVDGSPPVVSPGAPMTASQLTAQLNGYRLAGAGTSG